MSTSSTRLRTVAATACVAGLVALAGLTGCTAKPNRNLQSYAYSGEYGQARELSAAALVRKQERAARGGAAAKPDPQAVASPKDRDYMLNRMRYGLSVLADGYCADDPVFNEIYQVLSTQGVNAGKKMVAILVNEDLKVWKGEPFEQALMLSYLSVYYGMQGSWDNARAAASASQFYLADFGKNEKGERRSNQDLVKLAAETNDDQAFINKYTARETDFCLGILLDAIANRQLVTVTGDDARSDEAQSKFARVMELRPDLEALLKEVYADECDAVLVVGWGQGPQKIGTGPDNAIADWLIHTPSGGERLLVTSAAGSRAYPLVCDVNTMAKDHAWNNLEDVRIAKSVVGSVLVGAGAVTTGYALNSSNRDAAYVGLGMMAVGAIMKAGAHADTRYCEIVPQRLYVVPVTVEGPDSAVTLQVENQPVSRAALAGLRQRKDGEPVQLRYVNLVTRAPAAPAWASSGRVLYNNDYVPAPVARPWPYILGGECVRKPTQAALAFYQKNGCLTDMSLAELQDLYRQEGIDPNAPLTLRTRHVLEGGTSLESPLPGTLGFARLFGQPHRPYAPRTPRARELAAQLTSGTSQGVASASR